MSQFDSHFYPAPGPGYFSIELAKAGDYHITGLGISHTFMEILPYSKQQSLKKGCLDKQKNTRGKSARVFFLIFLLGLLRFCVRT